MVQKYITCEFGIKLLKKLMHLIALVYIIYFIVCSFLSVLGLLTNSINSITAFCLLISYILIIIFGMYIAQFKFRYDLIFIFALLVQIVY